MYGTPIGLYRHSSNKQLLCIAWDTYSSNAMRQCKEHRSGKTAAVWGRGDTGDGTEECRHGSIETGHRRRDLTLINNSSTVS